jgi:hypothetical protein
VAATQVAHRYDQPCATLAVAKIELDGIRPSAAMAPFGMHTEPAPVTPDNFIQHARHRDGAHPKVCRQPLLAGHTNP